MSSLFKICVKGGMPNGCGLPAVLGEKPPLRMIWQPQIVGRNQKHGAVAGQGRVDGRNTLPLAAVASNALLLVNFGATAQNIGRGAWRF